MKNKCRAHGINGCSFIEINQDHDYLSVGWSVSPWHLISCKPSCCLPAWLWVSMDRSLAWLRSCASISGLWRYCVKTCKSSACLASPFSNRLYSLRISFSANYSHRFSQGCVTPRTCCCCLSLTNSSMSTFLSLLRLATSSLSPPNNPIWKTSTKSLMSLVNVYPSWLYWILLITSKAQSRP